MARNRVQTVGLNPELETLRDSVQPVNNGEEILQDVIPHIKNIHAAFLFHGSGLKLLQKLCLYLSGTRDTYYSSGWKDFAAKLGLDVELANFIDRSSFNNEDETYNVMLAYVQNPDATVERILMTLFEIQRLDVINETRELFKEFGKKFSESCVSDNERLLKPFKVPEAPFALKSLDENDITAPVRTKRKYDKVVMLTYTKDSVFIAQMIANELRRKCDDKTVGVVILQEHQKKVHMNPESFILSCFAQANYIMPILSTAYLNLIASNTDGVFNNALDDLDNTYAKYIHKLIVNSYIRNGCCNDNIRCVIPDNMCEQVQRHPAMLNSELRIWVNLSQIETFRERILSDTF